jgi:hypothetical protein
MAELSAAEIEQYEGEGYVIPTYQLPTEQIDKVRATLDRLLRENPDVRPEKLVSAHIDGQNDEGVNGSSDFLELAQNPDILDLVAQVLGDDIILWGCHVFCKPGGTGLETPFHQDGHYWPIRPLATCTVWMALDRSDRENGCLQVIPKSHQTRELMAHAHEDREDLVLSQRADGDSFDEETAVALELEPGQMSLHDVYLLHGADANQSPRRRAGVALRYMPATSVFERDLRPADGKSGIPVSFATRPLWLVRGVDKTGQNDFAVGHS